MARLAAHAVVGRFVRELPFVEAAIHGAATEIRRADLPHQVAAVPQVVLGQAAFACR
jgi:hypothetical protein